MVFIFNCQSLHSSTQWFAFIHSALQRPPLEKMVVVTVPDLDNLQIKVNIYRGGQNSIDEQGQALVNGEPISAHDIVERCMTELQKETRLQDVLNYWKQNYQMGLCWKRYDRIEWFSGEGDELAASWSLKEASLSTQLLLTCRLIALNFVQRSTILQKSVLDSRNNLLNLFQSKVFSFALPPHLDDKHDSVNSSTRDYISLPMIIFSSFVLQRTPLLHHPRKCIIFSTWNLLSKKPTTSL